MVSIALFFWVIGTVFTLGVMLRLDGSRPDASAKPIRWALAWFGLSLFLWPLLLGMSVGDHLTTRALDREEP